jgi:hypothetical protein
MLGTHAGRSRLASQRPQTGAPSVAIGVAITSGSEASDHDQHASTQTNHAIRPIRSASVAIRFVNLPVDVVAPNSAPSSAAPTPLVPCHVALGTALFCARALSSPSNGARNQHAISSHERYSDALRCTRMLPDLLRFTQIHSYSLRFTQMHSDAISSPVRHRRSEHSEKQHRAEVIGRACLMRAAITQSSAAIHTQSTRN